MSTKASSSSIIHSSFIIQAFFSLYTSFLVLHSLKAIAGILLRKIQADCIVAGSISLVKGIFKMEQNFAPYDMEYMKMAMLKHEEIFKQQVYELHRLYRIQKLLMRTTSQRKISKNEHPKGTKHMRNLLLDLERPSEDCINKQPRMLDDQDDEAIDLSLGLGTCYNSQKMSANQLLTSNSVTSFSSSSSASSSRHSKNGRKYNYQQEQVRQENVAMLEQPPWLLQVLSLNMT